MGRRGLPPTPESKVGRAIRAAALAYKSGGQSDRAEGMLQAANIADKLLAGVDGQAGAASAADRMAEAADVADKLMPRTPKLGAVELEVMRRLQAVEDIVFSDGMSAIVQNEILRVSDAPIHKPNGAPAMRRPFASGLVVGDVPDELSKCERGLLGAMVLFGKPMPLGAILIRSGYRPSGAVNTAIASLRRSEFVAGSARALEVTAEGRNVLGPVEPMPTGEALIDYWVRELPTAAGGLLQAVWDGGGHITLERALEKTGYRPSGAVNTAVATLRKLGIFEPRGSLRLTGEFSAAVASR